MSGMKFNVMAIVFMVIAIAVGNILASWIAGFLGVAGGLFGIFVTGLVIYGLYVYLTNQKINIVSGVVFALLVWISGLLTGLVAGATGLGGGLLGLVVQAIILGLLAGKFMGGASPVSSSKAKKSGKRKRR